MRYATLLVVIVSIALLNWTPAWTQPADGGNNGAPANRPADNKKQRSHREGRDGGRFRGGNRLHERPPHGGLLSILDADRDGTLSADEIAAAPTALKQLDKNEDGKVTREELRAFFHSKHGPQRRDGKNFVDHIMSHDEDGDGKVEASELPHRMKRILDHVDANEDGAVDRTELEAMAEKNRHRGAHGGRDRHKRSEHSSD